MSDWFLDLIPFLAPAAACVVWGTGIALTLRRERIDTAGMTYKQVQKYRRRRLKDGGF